MQVLPQVVENLQCGVLGFKDQAEIGTFPRRAHLCARAAAALLGDRLARGVPGYQPLESRSLNFLYQNYKPREPGMVLKAPKSFSA